MPMTDLFAALAAHDSDTTRRLLEQGGIPLDEPDELGRTPLMAATAAGFCGGIRMLLDHGADINRANARGRTALHEAARHHGTDALALLIRRCAKPCVADGDGNTPLHLAAACENEDAAYMLIKRGCPVQFRNRACETPLELAITGRGEVMPLLRACKRAGVSLREDSFARGDFLLAQAARRKRPDEIEALGELGAPTAWHPDIGRDSALAEAVMHNSLECAESLIMLGYTAAEGFADERHSLLSWTVGWGNAAMLRLLMRYDPAPEYRLAERCNFLHHAARNGNAEMAHILLAAGFNPNAVDNSGLRPVQVAILARQFNIAKMLLSNGADADCTCPLSIALKKRHPTRSLPMLMNARKDDIPHLVHALAAFVKLQPNRNNQINLLTLAAMSGDLPLMEQVLHKDPALLHPAAAPAFRRWQNLAAERLNALCCTPSYIP